MVLCDGLTEGSSVCYVVALAISGAALQRDGNGTDSFTLREELGKVNTEPNCSTNVVIFWE